MACKKSISSKKITGYESLTSLVPTTDLLSYLNGLLSDDIVQVSTGMRYDQQVKYVSYNMDKFGFDSVELLQITDVQFGHRMCNVERMLEYRDWVLDKPNRFMIWTGDMIDAWRIGSPGAPLENILEPQGQVFKFVEHWAPARHRILGYIGGNHERRGLTGFGDLGILIATLLKIPYSNGQQFIDVKFGKHDRFKIATWHGVGGARTIGAKAMMIDRFMQKGDSQLYLVGHLHTCLVIPGVRMIRNEKHNRVDFQKIVGAMSSSFLQYFGAYAEVAGLTASDLMMAMATLYRDGKWQVSIR